MYTYLPITAESALINIKHANLYMETRLSLMVMLPVATETTHMKSPTATKTENRQTIKR